MDPLILSVQIWFLRLGEMFFSYLEYTDFVVGTKKLKCTQIAYLSFTKQSSDFRYRTLLKLVFDLFKLAQVII